MNKKDIALVQRRDRGTTQLLRDLRDRLLPKRAPFYVGVVLNRTFPIAGAQGRFIAGYDSLFGNLGVRASLEFGASPVSFSGALTSNFSLAATDGYLGLGLGMLFDPQPLGFSELFVGVTWHITYNIAVFAEARITSVFDADSTNLGAIDFGVQFRF
ncbi:MAG: hypothetical protein HC933_09600 [Pleurocapsa sp. SU_196_0]|nr:hypothetical protein [Pleurocapsa sp. SU_196_0]